jgi:hypothetical protein
LGPGREPPHVILEDGLEHVSRQIDDLRAEVVELRELVGRLVRRNGEA